MNQLRLSGMVLALFIGTMRAGGADGDGAEQLIERLREEWRSAPPIRAEYSVELTQSTNKSTYRVEYVRHGRRFDIIEYKMLENDRADDSEGIFGGLQRRAYDGKQVRVFTDKGAVGERCEGRVQELKEETTDWGNWVSANDLVLNAGWFDHHAWFDKYKPEFEFRKIGIEPIRGTDCVKVLVVTVQAVKARSNTSPSPMCPCSHAGSSRAFSPSHARVSGCHCARPTHSPFRASTW